MLLTDSFGLDSSSVSIGNRISQIEFGFCSDTSFVIRHSYLVQNNSLYTFMAISDEISGLYVLSVDDSLIVKNVVLSEYNKTDYYYEPVGLASIIQRDSNQFMIILTEDLDVNTHYHYSRRKIHFLKKLNRFGFEPLFSKLIGGKSIDYSGHKEKFGCKYYEIEALFSNNDSIVCKPAYKNDNWVKVSDLNEDGFLDIAIATVIMKSDVPCDSGCTGKSFEVKEIFVEMYLYEPESETFSKPLRVNLSKFQSDLIDSYMCGNGNVFRPQYE